jgi:hypothetical protein
MLSQKIHPEIIDSPNNILNLEKYNGRVNIIETPKIAVFEMHEKISVKNKATEYREAVTGEIEQTPMSRAFFSAKNIVIIQNAIRAGVYNKSENKYIIAQPGIDNLKIIMRSFYFDYANQGTNNPTEEIKKINNLVVDYCVRQLFNSAVSYERYLEDQSSLVMPMDRPLQKDRNYKQLEMNLRV